MVQKLKGGIHPQADNMVILQANAFSVRSQSELKMNEDAIVLIAVIFHSLFE
jgi:hypothetical protein